MLAKDKIVGRKNIKLSYENCNPILGNSGFSRNISRRLRTAIGKRHDSFNKLNKRAADAGWERI
jgi:hypothetical protein